MVGVADIARRVATLGIGTTESGDALTISNVETSASDFAGTDELFVQVNPNLGHSEKSFFNEFNTQTFSLPPTESTET
jgi:hypothetical protein